MKTSKEALCTHLNADWYSLSEYAYHPGRYSRTVYAIADGYYCATKDGKLPKPTKSTEPNFEWVEVPDAWVNKYGFKIYKAKENHESTT